MNLICSFFRPSQIEPGAEEEGIGLIESRPLDDLVNNVNRLSTEILSNDQIYDRIKSNYQTLHGYRGFANREYKPQCEALISDLDQLQIRRQQQQLERQDLQRELFSYQRSNPQLRGEGNIAEQMRFFESKIRTWDDLEDDDKDFRDMKDGTFDCFYCASGDSAATACILLSCFPIAIFCNRACCGLNGRIEQLRYQISKGT